MNGVGMRTSWEQIADGDAFGEAPVWDARRQCLIWSDIASQSIYKYDPERAEKTVLRTGLAAFGLVLNADGALIASGAGGLHYIDRCREPVLLGEPLAYNDLIADAAGRIYTGSFHWADGEITKPGSLHLIDESSCTTLDEGLTLPNGLGFSPDGRTLYVTDTFAHTIYAYDVEPSSGALSGRRVFASIPRADGMPDGLTVDSEGHVWSALWYGGRLARFDPGGRLNRILRLPVLQPSSVMFGGRDLDELYVTTAGKPFVSSFSPPGYDYDAPNQGGPLYRMRLGIRGLPERVSAFKAPLLLRKEASWGNPPVR